MTYLIAVPRNDKSWGENLTRIWTKETYAYWYNVDYDWNLLMSITFFPVPLYIVSCIFGYLLFGLGLGLFATPSTDTAISNSPEER